MTNLGFTFKNSIRTRLATFESRVSEHSLRSTSAPSHQTCTGTIAIHRRYRIFKPGVTGSKQYVATRSWPPDTRSTSRLDRSALQGLPTDELHQPSIERVRLRTNTRLSTMNCFPRRRQLGDSTRGLFHIAFEGLGTPVETPATIPQHGK